MSEQAPAEWIVLSVDGTLSDYTARVDAYARKLASEMSEMLPDGMYLEWGISASVTEPRTGTWAQDTSEPPRIVHASPNAPVIEIHDPA